MSHQRFAPAPIMLGCADGAPSLLAALPGPSPLGADGPTPSSSTDDRFSGWWTRVCCLLSLYFQFPVKKKALWQCLCQIMRTPPTQSEDIRVTASLPVTLGGLCLRSATTHKLLTCPVGLIVYPWCIRGLSHFGQSFFLLRPVPLGPVLFWPGPLRPALVSVKRVHKHGSCPLFDFQQAFMWNITGRSRRHST